MEMETLTIKLDALTEIVMDGFSEIRTELQQSAKKVDLEQFATKGDLEQFAKKSDLDRFATKSDLKNLATKDEYDELARMVAEGFIEVREHMATKGDMDALREELLSRSTYA